MNLVVNMAKLEQAGFGDILKSGDHKYIKREWKNNRWVYEYEEKKDKNGKPEESAGVAAVARGDTVQFKSGDKVLEGVVTDKGKMGVTINGTGEAKGIQYHVAYADVKKVEKPVNESDKIRPLMDKNAISAGWRNGFDGMQPKSCDTIEGLKATINAVRGEFSNITEGVKKQFSSLNPILLKRGELKGDDRIKEKLREDAKEKTEKATEAGIKDFKPEEYDAATDTYHCRSIRDCDGHTLCMKSIDDVEKLMQYFDKQPYVARMKNNFAKPSPVGYSDINMNIKLSNGAIVELQLNTTANMVAKERYGHAMYEVYRAIESNPKYKQLADIMGEGQKKLYKMSNEYSAKGNYPDDVPNGNIYDPNYKHEPYANAIRDYVNQAIPIFKEAAANGAFNAKTIKNFQHLIDYLK